MNRRVSDVRYKRARAAPCWRRRISSAEVILSLNRRRPPVQVLEQLRARSPYKHHFRHAFCFSNVGA